MISVCSTELMNRSSSKSKSRKLSKPMKGRAGRVTFQVCRLM